MWVLLFVKKKTLMTFIWIISLMFSDGYTDGTETEIPGCEATKEKWPAVSPESMPLPEQK